MNSDVPLLGPSDAPVPVLSVDERRRISWRLGSALLGLGLLLVGTIYVRFAPDTWQVGELIRAAAALVVGVPTLLSGAYGMARGDARRATDQLVAIAVLAAGATGDFVTATLIPVFLELGRLFEERSSLGARAAIDGIRALSARLATRIRNGQEETLAPELLEAGDLVLVRPGERVPADGIVREGTSAIDQAAITGESRPEHVDPGRKVFAGTVAIDGLLKVEVRMAGTSTALGQIVKLLAEVEASSIPSLRLFESRAGAWLPFVLTVAASTLFFTRDLSRTIGVLVAASPTALVVSGPAAVLALMSVATRLRILIKSAAFVERAAEVDTLVIDKTGTVTTGTAAVAELRPRAGTTEQHLLLVAARAAAGSRHPASRALVAEATRRKLTFEQHEQLTELAGRGVVARSAQRETILGRRELLAERGVNLDEERPDDDSSSVVWIAESGRCIGSVLLRDEVRVDAREALASIRSAGVERILLLTGDRLGPAREVASTLGLDQVVAQVLPAQKLEYVRKEQAEGRVVMMVGDGVNDAPALGGADVGVAVGVELNEVALRGADVAILGEDLRRIPQLLALARFTRRILGQNVALACGLSLLLITLAALGVVSPLLSAVLQSLTVIVVVGNATRILRFLA